MPEAGGLLLAFDFGKKRIGVATGNSLTRTASPLTTLTCHRDAPWSEIDALIADWKPDLLVVGHPGGDAGADLLESLAAFVESLASRYGIPIERVDESFSSTAALTALREDRRDGILQRRLQRGQIDSRAACLIAEQWMNQSIE